MKKFGILVILFALPIIQVSCSLAGPHTVDKISNKQLDIIKMYNSEARDNLPLTSSYIPDYKIWSSYKKYVGVFYRGETRVVTYKNEGNLSDKEAQDFLKYVRDTYNDQNIQIDILKEANTWGDWALLQQTLFRASRENIIPKIQGVGINPRNGRIIIRANDKSDIKSFMYVIENLGIPLNLVDFEVDRLVLLGGKTSGGSEMTGTLPIRSGSLVSNDQNGVCTVGGLAKLISTDSGGFIVPLHCIEDTRYSDINTNFRSPSLNEYIGKVRYVPSYLDGTNIDAAFISLSTTSYKKVLIEGKKQENYYNEFNGTRVNAISEVNWRIVYKAGDVTLNTLKFYGGMHGLNTIQIDQIYDTVERVKVGAMEIQALMICAKSSSPNISLGRGDSGAPVLDSNNQVVGILSSVSDKPDIQGKRNYCFTSTGEIQRRMNVKLL